MSSDHDPLIPAVKAIIILDDEVRCDRARWRQLVRHTPQ